MKLTLVKLSGFVAGAMVVGGALLSSVSAQASQDSKNNWRNLGLASAVVAVVGIANHDRALTAIGLAGTAYSASRYDEDRSNEGCGPDGRWRGDDRDNRWHGEDRGWRRDDGDNRWHGEDRGWRRDDGDNRWHGDNRGDRDNGRFNGGDHRDRRD